MTIADLLLLAAEIKNETVAKANTATRVGTMLEEIIDNLPKRVTISLTDAQILAATQVTAIAAPGAGKAIEVLRTSVKYTHVSAVYNVATTIEVWTNTATIHQVKTANILSVAASSFVKAASGVSASTEIVENQAVYVKADVASTTGNGTAKIYITYQIIDL